MIKLCRFSFYRSNLIILVDSTFTLFDSTTNLGSVTDFSGVLDFFSYLWLLWSALIRVFLIIVRLKLIWRVIVNKWEGSENKSYVFQSDYFRAGVRRSTGDVFHFYCLPTSLRVGLRRRSLASVSPGGGGGGKATRRLFTYLNVPLSI